MTSQSDNGWMSIDTEGGAIPSLRSGHSAAPSGPSRFASWAKPAAVIAGELLVLFVLSLTIFAPAIFGGS